MTEIRSMIEGVVVQNYEISERLRRKIAPFGGCRDPLDEHDYNLNSRSRDAGQYCNTPQSFSLFTKVM